MNFLYSGSPVFTSWHDELSGRFNDPGTTWYLKVGPDLLDDPVLHVDVGPDRAVGVDHITPFDEKAVLGTLKVKRNLLHRHVTTIHAAAVACHFYRRHSSGSELVNPQLKNISVQEV